MANIPVVYGVYYNMVHHHYTHVTYYELILFWSHGPGGRNKEQFISYPGNMICVTGHLWLVIFRGRCPHYYRQQQQLNKWTTQYVLISAPHTIAMVTTTLQDFLYLVIDTNILLSHLQFLAELKDCAIKGSVIKVLLPWLYGQLSLSNNICAPVHIPVEFHLKYRGIYQSIFMIYIAVKSSFSC